MGCRLPRRSPGRTASSIGTTSAKSRTSTSTQRETIDTLYGRRMRERCAAGDGRCRPLTAYAREPRTLAAQSTSSFKTLTPSGGTRLVRDIDHEAIAAPGPARWRHGGRGRQQRRLCALGPIDEYCAYVHPVILGGGTPMFPAPRERLALEIVETRTFSSGVVLMRYVPRNEP